MAFGDAAYMCDVGWRITHIFSSWTFHDADLEINHGVCYYARIFWEEDVQLKVHRFFSK